MSFVHVNALLFRGKGILDGITFLGATVCFVVFLFGIGYVSGKKILENREDSWNKIGNRVLWIYLCYLVLGIFYFYISNKSLNLKNLFNIAVFNYLPEFTEFLVALIFYTILSKLLLKPLQRLMGKPYLLLVISIFMLILGSVLSKVDVSSQFLAYLQKHLVGVKDGVHVFPLLQYLPIYVLGILSAKYGSKLNYAWAFSISFLLLVLLMAFGAQGWYRWPPSLNFILYGVIFISFVMFLLQFVKENICTKHLTLFGRYPLFSLFLLTIITFILFFFIKIPSESHLLLWILNISILSFSYLVIYLLKK